MMHSHLPHMAVIACYLVIAYQFRGLLRGTRRDLRGRVAQGSMVVIFIVCSVVGYIFDMVDEPIWANLLGHGVLLVSSLAFILLQGARTIENAIRN